MAVAEEFLVELGSEVRHGGGAVVRRSEPGRFGVEGVDVVGDAVIGVGDGAVRDARVDERHPQRLVTQHLRNGLQGHAAIDRLSREGVAKLVRVNVANPSSFRDPSEHARDHVPIEATTAENDQSIDVIGSARSVLIELLEELVM